MLQCFYEIMQPLSLRTNLAIEPALFFINMKGIPLYIMNIRKISFNKAIVLTIFLLCLITVLIQGTALSSMLSDQAILIGCILIIIVTILCLCFFHRNDKLTEEKIIFAIIFMGMIFHCCYVLLSGIHDRQHDEGTYTGIASSQINPGHLGYIEYIYKFHRLPDMNPYELFSYYHPPLHHLLSALWLTLLRSLGMAEELAFENLQALPLFYSGLFMFITYLIMKKAGAKGRGFYAGLFFVSMHPALVLMSGSVNNDMLSVVLLACCLLSAMCFIRERSFKNLILIALSIGFGMISKLNVAVMAFPIGLIFLMDFITVIRGKDKQVIAERVRNYIVFGVVTAIIGLSWIVRNLIRFREKPGIPTPPGIMYTGDYSIWARLGIPALADWHFDFPFHPLSGKVIHNTWIIMLQTSLFGEVYPQYITDFPLALCRIAYIAAIVFAVLSLGLFFVMQYRKVKRPGQTNVYDAVFLASGYFIVLLSFAAFILKYPYTCSSDFRYVVIGLVYVAVGLADSGVLCDDKTKAAVISRVIRIGVCAVPILTTIIYMIWHWDGTF